MTSMDDKKMNPCGWCITSISHLFLVVCLGLGASDIKLSAYSITNCLQILQNYKSLSQKIGLANY